MNKRVSVIMPAYNSEKYIDEAISSVLNQTYKDFILYVINDGSTDKTRERIIKYSKQDPRVILVDNEENKGLIYTLNRGIDLSDSEYILRMDSDDIMMRNKIEKQIRFMDSNSNVKVLGTLSRDFTDFDKKGRVRLLPVTHKKIRTHLLFTSPMVHPSVMMRREIFANDIRYENNYKSAEDYALWSKLIVDNEFANLKEPLLKYRVLESSITRTMQKSEKKIERDKVLKSIYKINFENLGILLSEGQYQIYRDLINLELDITDKNKKEKFMPILKAIKENIDEDLIEESYVDYMIVKYIRLNLQKSHLSVKEKYAEIKNSYSKYVKFDLLNKLLLLRGELNG